MITTAYFIVWAPVGPGLRKQTTGRLGENPFDNKNDNKSTIGPQAMGFMHHAI